MAQALAVVAERLARVLSRAQAQAMVAV